MADMFTLAQLRLLSHFESATSISAVARMVGLSQPTVSLTLRSIESKLGRVLVQRSAGGSELTPDGRAVLTWAQGLLSEAKTLDELLDTLGEKPRCRLRIAASLTIAEYLLPVWLVSLTETGIRRDVELTVANSDRVMSLVQSRQADCGFVEGHGIKPGLHSAKVGNDDLLVIVGLAHPWATLGRPISVSELLAGQLLLREPGSGTREVFERALRAHGGTVPENSITLGSTSAIKLAARTGNGAGIVSRLSVRDELSQGSIRGVHVEGLDMRRSLRMVRLRGQPFDDRLDQLIQVARRQVPDMHYVRQG